MSKLDQALGFYESSLRLRSQRQQILAANIANADTPGYQAKDLDFKNAMQGALSGEANFPQAGIAMSRTDQAHIEDGGDALSSLLSAHVVPRKVTQNASDGNTVDMDIERAAFAENALHYEADIKLAHDQIKGLLSVLQG